VFAVISVTQHSDFLTNPSDYTSRDDQNKTRNALLAGQSCPAREGAPVFN
jgi:hypothetical protein